MRKQIKQSHFQFEIQSQILEHSNKKVFSFFGKFF